MSHKQAKRLRKAGVVKTKRPADVWIGDHLTQAQRFGVNDPQALHSLAKRVAKHMGLSGKTYPAQSLREIARRQRQIAKGMLKVSE